MTFFFLCIYLGGVNVVYVLNRAKGFGVIRSALEAGIWPFGVGTYMALNFYINADWAGKK